MAPKKAEPSPRGLSREIARLRKRVERAEEKTKDLKEMMSALEHLLDESIK